MVGYQQERAILGLTAINVANTTAVYTARIGLSFKANSVILIVSSTLTTGDTVTLKRNKEGLTPNSNSTIGTFVVPTMATPGDVCLVDISTASNTDVDPGESFSLEAVNGTGTGQAIFGVIGYEYLDGPHPTASFSETAKLKSGVGSLNYAAFTAA